MTIEYKLSKSGGIGWNYCDITIVFDVHHVKEKDEDFLRESAKGLLQHKNIEEHLTREMRLFVKNSKVIVTIHYKENFYIDRRSDIDNDCARAATQISSILEIIEESGSV